MSQSINIIETSEMDRSRELDGIVPESTYYHSTGIIQRHHAKMSPYEANLVGANANDSKGIPYNWQINATPNSVLNLNEMYFEINGELDVVADWTKLKTSTSNNNITEVTVRSEDLLIPSDLWFLSAFQNVQLRIGDAVVYQANNPIVQNVLRKLMFHGKERNDIEGFAGSHAFPVESMDSTTKKIKHEADVIHKGLYNFSNGSIEGKELVFTSDKSTQKVKFSVIMRISDLFNTDDLLPIFNQQVKLTLQRSAIDDLSIQCAIDGFSVKLSNISYFQLNIFQYLLDPSNSQALMNIYSQPKTVVFSTTQQVFQTITATSGGNQVTVNSPTGLLFGAKFLMMYLTKSNTNSNVVPKLYIRSDDNINNKLGILISTKKGNTGDDANKYILTRGKVEKMQARRFPVCYMGPHAPLNLMYNNVNINCDNYTVLYDDITPLRQDFCERIDDEVSIAPHVYIDRRFLEIDHEGTVGQQDYKDLNVEHVYYNRLYHEYCESCKHTGIEPITREEFLNCYPVVMAELSDFSKISTNSFLNITFNNSNASEGDEAFKSPYRIDGNLHNQLNIICYGLRALQLSNGFARIMEVDNTINNNMEDVLATSSA